jgi:hypothetical protein
MFPRYFFAIGHEVCIRIGKGEHVMRKAGAAVAVIALLVVLYAAAGTWLAPRFAREALVEQAHRQGLELRMEAVRTNPFALRIDLDGLDVRTQQGMQVATARRVTADLAWASLWEPQWVVQRITLEQPHLKALPGGGSAEPKRAEKTPLRVQQIQIVDGALTVDALQLVAINVDVHDLAAYRLAANTPDGGKLASQGRVALDPPAAQGHVAMEGIPVEALRAFAAPGMLAGAGRVNATARFAYEKGRVVLEEVQVRAVNVAYGEGRRRIALDELRVSAPRFAFPAKEAFALEASAKVKGGGELHAKGNVVLQPLSADLRIDAGALPLARAQPWLPQGAAVQLVSGALGASGRLRLARSAVSYEGSLAVNDLRIDEAQGKNLLLGWSRLQTSGAKLHFGPDRRALELGEVLVRAPRGRLIIGSDGRINFTQLFGQGTGGEGPALQASVQRLRIEQGTLDFADRSLANAFAVTIRELDGTVSGLSTRSGEPARVRLAGRVDKYGSARIRGTLDLEAPKSRTDIRATFRNLDLVSFSPYFAKFAGYRVESGRLSANLRYEVRDARLTGRNDLVIERLKLGEKVQSASALDLPLEVAVAVLADAEGRINLDIPVRGNLNDPQFDFGGLVARAIGNVITRVASAPFRALAGLFGKKADGLDAVHFAAGSAELAPPQQEDIAVMAKALGERPQLELAVQGGYDPQADAAALRVRVVRQEIAKRAGYEGGGVDFQDPKVLHAAENLYLKRVGNRLELHALRDSGKPYGRALLEKLAATVAVDEAQAQSLATARAQAVRKALVEQGVAQERVHVEPAAPADAGKEGVPTRLSLAPRAQ